MKLALLLLATGFAPAPAQDFVTLFNGKDFSGIKFVLGPNCVAAPVGCAKSDPGDIVWVENHEIRCACNVHGYLYFANRKYKDFTLRFEARMAR